MPVSLRSDTYLFVRIFFQFSLFALKNDLLGSAILKKLSSLLIARAFCFGLFPKFCILIGNNLV
jgi:hypothetical protein